MEPGKGCTKQVIIFIGPPGSGKDTQANLLVEEYGMVQMPSSHLLRAKFASNPDDPDIKREKELFDTGKLNTGPFVAEVMMEFVRAQAAQGKNLIFSGSPRTLHEAEVEFAELEKLFSLECLHVIHLTVPEDEAIRRISSRRFCRANSHPIPGTPEFAHLKSCPKDGSELYVRPLDDPKLYATRLNEYRTLTEPCLELARKLGLAITEIDGTKTIEAIHADIATLIERHRAPVPRD